jgi:hypothetical protein
VRRADILTTFICRLSRRSGRLNLEPYGPVQVCNGIALRSYQYLSLQVVLSGYTAVGTEIHSRVEVITSI